MKQLITLLFIGIVLACGQSVNAQLEKKLITKNGAARAEPIQIRNTNEPLYILDGVFVSAAELSEIKPEDIENITALNEKTAANFCRRGVSQIIVITLKKPKQQEDTALSIEKGKLSFTDKFDVSAFPNPSEGEQLEFRFTGFDQDQLMTIQVMSINGKNVMTKTIDPKNSLESPSAIVRFEQQLEAGIYVAMITQGVESKAIKLVIK